MLNPGHLIISKNNAINSSPPPNSPGTIGNNKDNTNNKVNKKRIEDLAEMEAMRNPSGPAPEEQQEAPPEEHSSEEAPSPTLAPPNSPASAYDSKEGGKKNEKE